MQVPPRAIEARDRITFLLDRGLVPSIEELRQLKRDLILLIKMIKSLNNLHIFSEEEWTEIDTAATTASAERLILKTAIQNALVAGSNAEGRQILEDALTQVT